MARERNPQTIAAISDAAWNLFQKKGYAKTSYSEIAKAAGVNRSTTQDYFPNKRLLAADALGRLRAWAEKAASQTYPEVDDPFAMQYIIGQIYIAALLTNNESKRFFCEVLEDRALTDEMILLDLSWSADKISHNDSSYFSKMESRQNLIVAMGGLYELIYFCVQNDEPLDIAGRLQAPLRATANLLSLNAEECEKTFMLYRLSEDERKKLSKVVYDSAFTPSA